MQYADDLYSIAGAAGLDEARIPVQATGIPLLALRAWMTAVRRA
jgi:hypothetical protein